MRGRRARHLKTCEALENTRSTNTEQLSFPVLFGARSRASTISIHKSRVFSINRPAQLRTMETFAPCVTVVPVKFVVKKAGSVSSNNVGFVTNNYLIQNPPSWIAKNEIASITKIKEEKENQKSFLDAAV